MFKKTINDIIEYTSVPICFVICIYFVSSFVCREIYLLVFRNSLFESIREFAKTLEGKTDIIKFTFDEFELINAQHSNIMNMAYNIAFIFAIPLTIIIICLWVEFKKRHVMAKKDKSISNMPKEIKYDTYSYKSIPIIRYVIFFAIAIYCIYTWTIRYRVSNDYEYSVVAINNLGINKHMNEIDLYDIYEADYKNKFNNLYDMEQAWRNGKINDGRMCFGIYPFEVYSLSGMLPDGILMVLLVYLFVLTYENKRMCVCPVCHKRHGIVYKNANNSKSTNYDALRSSIETNFDVDKIGVKVVEEEVYNIHKNMSSYNKTQYYECENCKQQFYKEEYIKK